MRDLLFITHRIILARRLSLTEWRFRTLTAKRHSVLRLLPSVCSRLALSSLRKFTSNTNCIDSMAQRLRTASLNRLPPRYQLRMQYHVSSVSLPPACLVIRSA